VSSKRIFVLEDESDIVEVISYHLERELFEVATAANGEAGLDAIRTHPPSLVILDLLLPGIDGLEVCRRLKKHTTTRDIPIVMLTAKGEESDVILGLGLGADDYIIKPFSPKELVARIKAVLRRSQKDHGGTDGQHVVRGGLEIDEAAFRARLDDRPLTLTATEFRLLYFLASNPGRVFTRDQLINHAIGERVAVIDRNIDVHIRALRKKLGDNRHFIETVRGVGYRFEEDENDG
jgi:DNA-binding response OmpR family regulator